MDTEQSSDVEKPDSMGLTFYKKPVGLHRFLWFLKPKKLTVLLCIVFKDGTRREYCRSTTQAAVRDFINTFMNEHPKDGAVSLYVAEMLFKGHKSYSSDLEGILEELEKCFHNSTSPSSSTPTSTLH